MLNALSAFIGYNERVVTIEDTRELLAEAAHCDPRVACPPNSEGKGEFTMHELLVGALRERPDRIVVGECRDDETLRDASGHADGSRRIAHDDPCERLRRCIHTYREHDPEEPGGNMTMEAIRQIGLAIDVVVQGEALEAAYRRIESITAVEAFPTVT